MNIENNIRSYLYGDASSKDRDPSERSTSFDYCFNYFQSFRERNDVATLASSSNLEASCLHLAFYLASWGMFRGRSPLLQRSTAHFIPLIQLIAACENELWEIDAHAYDDYSINLLFGLAEEIRGTLGRASDILVTKIILGVFGSVPAFDMNFRWGFNVSSFRKKSLIRIGEFYQDNQELIEKGRVSTLDFNTGTPSQRVYTRAKVIDMIFFIEGARLSA